MFIPKSREVGFIGRWAISEGEEKTTSEEELQRTFSGELVLGHAPKCEQQS